MRKSIFSFFFTVLLVSTLAFAASEIPDPAKVSKLNVRIVQSGQISAQYDAVEWIRLNLTAPQETPFQRAATQQNLIETEHGDKVIHIYEENPQFPFTYNTLTLATIQATHITQLPDSYTIPEDAKQYLSPTSGIQSDDPRIKRLAQEITQDAVTNFEKVALLAIWVNDYITYDLTYADRNYDAIWALENKVGVCSEYTSLFMALARSIGIPARYVSSYAYGQAGWEAHAYAEVYIGEWVPVDALWLQAGNLDATHIKFSINEDNQAANDVTVYGKDIRNLEWSRDDTEIKILGFEEEQSSEDYELIKSADVFGPGQEGVILLTFKGEEYRLMEISLEPCIGDVDGDGQRDTIVDVINKQRVVILEPGKDAFVYWQFKTSENLQANSLYTCPLTLNSRLLKARSIDVKINTANLRQDAVELDASLSSEVINIGSQQTVTIKATRQGRGRETVSIGVLGGGKEETFELAQDVAEETFTFSFPVNHPGNSEVALYTSTGTLEILPYEANDKGDVIIEQTNMPNYLAAGDKYQASIKLRNKRPGAQMLSVETTIDGKKDIRQLSLETTETLTIPLSFADVGKHSVDIRVAGTNVDIGQTYTIDVFETPEVSVVNSYYDTKIGKTVVVLSSTSKVHTVELIVDGKTYSVESVSAPTTVLLDVPAGAYGGQITYQDLAGKDYAAPLELFVRKQSFFSSILAFLKELLQVF